MVFQKSGIVYLLVGLRGLLQYIVAYRLSNAPIGSQFPPFSLGICTQDLLGLKYFNKVPRGRQELIMATFINIGSLRKERTTTMSL